MKSNQLIIGKINVVELISDEVIIRNVQDALDIMGNFQADAFIFQLHHFEDDFYDLSTRKLGEILQKFTNYRIRLAIIGDFQKFKSQTLKDFIYETNKFGSYLFVSSIDEVIKKWE